VKGDGSMYHATMAEKTFGMRVVEIIRSIPFGMVSTYGGVAALAGNHRAARQVVRVLHSLSGKEGLPWHRVVNKQGRIALREDQGFELQRELLAGEGVDVSEDGCIDLTRYLWFPEAEERSDYS